MNSRTIKTTVSPYDQEIVFEYCEHDERDVDAIIGKCHRVAPYWGALKLSERTYFLSELQSELKRKKETLATTITKEMGKPLTQSYAEVDKCIKLLEFYQAAAQVPHPLLQVPAGVSSKIEFAPLGVVLAIMPWNFPLWQVFRCAIPALMGGNGVILKHASNVAYTSTMLNDCFNECGLPEDLFGTILYPAEKMEQVIERSEISAISFTGSSEVGSKIAGIAARKTKKTVLELGGMDPYIVLQDADLANAAREIARARLVNSGQSCIAAKRCFVHQEVLDPFLKLLTAEFESYQISNPLCQYTDIGPIAKEQIAQDARSSLKADLERGAEIVYEAELENVKYRENFIAPTIVRNVTPKMQLMSEEIFAPILPVMAFEGHHQVISLANQNPYGLGAAVFSSHDQLIHDIVSRLQCGNVGINCMVTSHPAVPFGGVKASGHGRELGLYGALEFQNVKSLYFK